jgi:hypothetical protein
MPRKDGNKSQNEELEKMILTAQNVLKNEEFLAENAGELTPHQLKDVKKHLSSKRKSLEESEGTIKY